jgi:catechol 2,3-dioxygenase-like lactoylglutathione lyase family enzyme
VRLTHVLETVLYYRAEERDETLAFYRDVLGLLEVDEGLAFRLGDGVEEEEDADAASRQQRPPPHGAHGAGHTCFVAERGTYDAWKERLLARRVSLTDEIAWRSGVRSFYFDDPAGNVLEIADGDLWPRA